MEGVTTMSMDPGKALEVYQTYRASLRENHRQEWRRQDEALKKAYRQMSRGLSVIDLVAAFRTTGLGQNDLPKLAIARADVRTCSVEIHGAWAFFYSDVEGRHRGNLPRTEIPRGTFSHDGWKRGRAQVPFMPPAVRPKRSLENFWILWEARWDQVPPVDPMLLQPLGCNLWVVRAAWDLTDVERAVMDAALRG